jgi:hypothetical protein
MGANRRRDAHHPRPERWNRSRGFQELTVIKILRAQYLHNFVVQLDFSDGSVGDYDIAPLFARNTVLTRAWQDPEFFRRFFIELGALTWPNGLELSPESIHQRLEDEGKLRRTERVA